MHYWFTGAALKNGLQLVLPAKQEVIFAISKMFSQSSLGSVRPLDNKKLNLVSMFQTLGVCVQIFYVIWNSRSPSTTRCQERTCSAEFDLLLLGTSFFHKEDNCLNRYKTVPFPGTDGSGKSTFLRQMKIIHDGGFTDEELADIKPDVYR